MAMDINGRWMFSKITCRTFVEVQRCKQRNNSLLVVVQYGSWNLVRGTDFLCIYQETINPTYAFPRTPTLFHSVCQQQR